MSTSSSLEQPKRDAAPSFLPRGPLARSAAARSAVRRDWCVKATNRRDTRTSGEHNHESAVAHHYDTLTEEFYLGGWNPDHIHFGLFEREDRPRRGESLQESAGLARAVERMVDVVVAPAAIAAHHHVVDAGCGVGGTAIRLVRQTGCRVTGVSLSSKQLEIARRKAADTNLGHRIAFNFADCSRSLPFADNSVDAVVNIESACHYSDRERFLREVRRILKPGGRLAAMDWMTVDNLSKDQNDRFIRPLCEAWPVSGLESEGSYTGKLRDAGLRLIEFEGFDGKDEENLRIIKERLNLLLTLKLFGIPETTVQQYTALFEPLCEAWSNKVFVLGRYCAERP